VQTHKGGGGGGGGGWSDEIQSNRISAFHSISRSAVCVCVCVCVCVRRAPKGGMTSSEIDWIRDDAWYGNHRMCYSSFQGHVDCTLHSGNWFFALVALHGALAQLNSDPSLAFFPSLIPPLPTFSLFQHLRLSIARRYRQLSLPFPVLARYMQVSDLSVTRTHSPLLRFILSLPGQLFLSWSAAGCIGQHCAFVLLTAGAKKMFLC